MTYKNYFLAAALMLPLAHLSQAIILPYQITGTFAKTFTNETIFTTSLELDGADFVIDFEVDSSVSPVTNNDGTPGSEAFEASYTVTTADITISNSPNGDKNGTFPFLSASSVTLVNSYGTNPSNDLFVFEGINPTGLSDNIVDIRMIVDLGSNLFYEGTGEPDVELIALGVVLSETPPVSPVVGPGAVDPSPNSPSFLFETFFLGDQLTEYVPQNATLVPEANASHLLAMAALLSVLVYRRRQARASV
ncbi:MAG: hypothetical protein AAGA45_05365 [Verrucomicrobiota bacterium]